MPFGFETETGYYDDKGMFHQNVGLIPVAQGFGSQIVAPIQIHENQTYDPGFSAQIWTLGQEFSLPALPDFTNVQNPGSNILGGLVGGATSAFVNSTILPAGLFLGALFIFRKPITKFVKKL